MGDTEIVRLGADLSMVSSDLPYSARTQRREHLIRSVFRVGEKMELSMFKDEKGVRLGSALFDRERGNMQAAFDWLASRPDQESAQGGALLNVYMKYDRPSIVFPGALLAESLASSQQNDRHQLCP